MSWAATKLINNMVLFQNVVGLAERLSLARTAGLDARRLLETLAKGSADSFALRNHASSAPRPPATARSIFRCSQGHSDAASRAA
ncbi:MAG TPA: NAD-binding protein [Burkholderiales bacterium]|nr:NAD-binding protein [Burkholderiales bacterium]